MVSRTTYLDLFQIFFELFPVSIVIKSDLYWVVSESWRDIKGYVTVVRIRVLKIRFPMTYNIASFLVFGNCSSNGVNDRFVSSEVLAQVGLSYSRILIVLPHAHYILHSPRVYVMHLCMSLWWRRVYYYLCKLSVVLLEVGYFIGYIHTGGCKNNVFRIMFDFKSLLCTLFLLLS